MKTLLLDIETMANMGWFWGNTYETNIIEVIQSSFILSFAYKWFEESGVIVKGLPDYKGYKPCINQDEKLVRELRDLLDEADMVVAHNGKAFDFKEINRRIILHGLTPPSPYKMFDTKTEFKKVSRFTSNKADYLGQELEIGRKLEHEGWPLWKRCYTGDMSAWDKMKRYNKQDVILLEGLYLKIRPWTRVNAGTFLEGIACPKCGSKNLHKRGFFCNLTSRYQRIQCQDCGGWSRNAVNQQEFKPLISL